MYFAALFSNHSFIYEPLCPCSGPDKGAYYHELFLRSKIFLCQKLQRVKIKGSKPGRIKAYAETEPDFYKMRPMPHDDEEVSVDTPPIGQADHLILASSAQSSGPLIRPAVATQFHEASIVRPGGLFGTSAFNSGQNMLMPNDSGQLSFLSGQPQPMTISRSPPHSGPQGEESQKEEPFASSLLGIDNFTSMMQSTSGLRPFSNSEPFRAGGVVLKEDEMLSGRSNIGGLLSVGSNGTHIGGTLSRNPSSNVFNSLAYSFSSDMAHPQLREQQTEQRFQPPPLQLLQPRPQPQQPPQPPPTFASIDEMDMPNDVLIDILPTAQSLALENLFDQEAAMSNIAQQQEMMEQQMQQMQRMQHIQLEQQQQQQQQALQQFQPLSIQYDPFLYAFTSEPVTELEAIIESPPAAHLYATTTGPAETAEEKEGREPGEDTSDRSQESV